MLLAVAGIVDTQLADVALPVEDQLAAMEVHPQVRGVRFADDMNQHGRADDEGCNGGGHDPVHRGAGDLDALGRALDDAALMRDRGGGSDSRSWGLPSGCRLKYPRLFSTPRAGSMEPPPRGFGVMQAIMSMSGTVLLAAASLVAGGAGAQIDNSIRGAPSEANHFIETPAGWRHPLTPWGEPDIAATLDMMQGVARAAPSAAPTAISAGAYRRSCSAMRPEPVAARGRGRVRLEKAWLTQAEYDERIAEWRNQIDASRTGIGGRRHRPRDAYRHAGPEHPAAADELIVGPADRVVAGADRGREAPSAHDARRLGAAGRESRVRRAAGTSIAGTAASRAACRRR